MAKRELKPLALSSWKRVFNPDGTIDPAHYIDPYGNPLSRRQYRNAVLRASGQGDYISQIDAKQRAIKAEAGEYAPKRYKNKGQTPPPRLGPRPPVQRPLKSVDDVVSQILSKIDNPLISSKWLERKRDHFLINAMEIMKDNGEYFTKEELDDPYSEFNRMFYEAAISNFDITAHGPFALFLEYIGLRKPNYDKNIGEGNSSTNQPA
jgi:hypothetical protein